MEEALNVNLFPPIKKKSTLGVLMGRSIADTIKILGIPRVLYLNQDDPMVITIDIALYNVSKMLVDQGSFVNILY